jgi:excisionase family DNA binding protein
MENDWLDADETASSLQITKATLYKLVHDARIPARKVGGQWRFNRLDIEAMFVGAAASATTRPERNQDG